MPQLSAIDFGKDNAAVLELMPWLRTAGWDILFLDLDFECGKGWSTREEGVGK